MLNCLNGKMENQSIEHVELDKKRRGVEYVTTCKVNIEHHVHDIGLLILSF